MPKLDHRASLDTLARGDEAAKLAVLKTLSEVAPEDFEKSQLPAFFKALQARIQDGSKEVQYNARKALDRLKGFTGLGDLALVLTEFLDEADRDAEPERPELVYGTIPYWLHELTSKDFRVRVKAVMELARTGQRRIFDTLCENQAGETHEWVRATYAKYLGHFKYPETYGRVAGYLKDPDPRVRANCLEGLELLADPQSVPAVQPLLEDPDNRVRANAAKVLVKFDLASVQKALDSMLASPEEWMRDSATYILARIEFPGIEAYLDRALADPNPVIASKAARALARKGDPEEARARLRSADGSRDERLAKAIAEALQQLG